MSENSKKKKKKENELKYLSLVKVENMDVEIAKLMNQKKDRTKLCKGKKNEMKRRSARRIQAEVVR